MLVRTSAYICEQALSRNLVSIDARAVLGIHQGKQARTKAAAAAYGVNIIGELASWSEVRV